MKYLLIGLSTRGLAESALKAGKDFVTIDFFGDLDQKQICDGISLRREYAASLDSLNPFLFLKAASPLEFAHMVYGGPLENHPEILRRFAERCEIVGNDAETVREVRNWKNLHLFCRKNSILVPETVDGIEYVKKPKRSGGGIGIQRLSRYVVQKFMKGDHFSVSFLGNGKQAEVVSVNEQLIGRKEFGARKFWYCGNITPISLDSREEIAGICRRLTGHFRLKGNCGMDFVMGDGLYVMEVNPRPQATLEIVERAFDLNLFLLHENAFKGEIEKIGNPIKTWGKAILYAEKDVIMPKTHKWLDYNWIKDIPHPSEHISKSEPVCTVIADGCDRDDCYEHLIERAESVKELIQE
jgi:predicted ATP-grasp superfamily ATP-dependent carboligase